MIAKAGAILQALEGFDARVTFGERVGESLAGDRYLRASLYGGWRDADERHVERVISGRSLYVETLRGDSALVGLLDNAVRHAARAVFENAIIRRFSPLLPFALFAADHLEDNDVQKFAPSLIELWRASPEQHKARRQQALKVVQLADWSP